MLQAVLINKKPPARFRLTNRKYNSQHSITDMDLGLDDRNTTGGVGVSTTTSLSKQHARNDEKRGGHRVLVLGFPGYQKKSDIVEEGGGQKEGYRRQTMMRYDTCGR